jgi:hypothetical protein
LFENAGVDKSRTECMLVKSLPKYPHLSPEDRCNPALLAYVKVLEPSDAQIISGPEPAIVAFDEYDGSESFDERAMKLLKEIKDLKQCIAELKLLLKQAQAPPPPPPPPKVPSAKVPSAKVLTFD